MDLCLSAAHECMLQFELCMSCPAHTAAKLGLSGGGVVHVLWTFFELCMFCGPFSERQ